MSIYNEVKYVKNNVKKSKIMEINLNFVPSNKYFCTKC